MPLKQTEKYTRGTITGLAITSGLNTSQFLFVMSRADVTIGVAMEVLRLLRERKINVKDAQKLLKEHIATKVK
jgi:hypothetical protein